MADTRPPIDSFFKNGSSGTSARPSLDSFTRKGKGEPEPAKGRTKTSLGGDVLRSVGKMFARPIKSAVAIGQVAMGKPEAEATKPTYSKYLGNIYPVGYGKGIDPTSTPVRSVLDSASEGVDVGLNAATFGTGGIAKDAAETAGKQILKGVTKQGIKTLAKEGAAYGGASGLSTGLEKASTDKTAGKGALDVVKNVAEGTVGGAIAGPIISKVGSTILGRKTQETLEKDALDLISPKLTPTEKETAVAAGRGKTSGIFNKIKVEADKKTQDAAKVVSGIVKKGKTFTENINNVREALSQKAEDLKNKIAKSDVSYAFKDLNARLRNVEKPISIKSDTTLSKQFDLVRDAFMKIAKEGKGTISSLLDARKNFDALIEKEFPNLFDKENAPMRNAVTSMRNEINSFIEENAPNAGYKKSLREQSLMYHAIDNLATKAKSEVETNAISRFAQRNPRASTAIGTAAAVVGGEKLVNGAKNLFSSSGGSQ